MAALDQAYVSKILNASLPTGGTAGNPGTAVAALAAGVMLLRLDSTAPTASAPGTQLSGTNYPAGGLSLGTTSSTASSAGSAVTLPAVSGGLSIVGSAWTINGLDITDSASLRTWFGTWNGAPITVASGNTFAIAQNAVSIGLT